MPKKTIKTEKTQPHKENPAIRLNSNTATLNTQENQAETYRHIEKEVESPKKPHINSSRSQTGKRRKRKSEKKMTSKSNTARKSKVSAISVQTENTKACDFSLLQVATHSLFTQLTCTEYSHATKLTHNMAACHGRDLPHTKPAPEPINSGNR